MNFRDEREWASTLVATINEQVEAVVNLPARTPTEERRCAELRRRAVELQHWARTIQRGVELKATQAENAALRRQLKRLASTR